jgi:thioredoxin 1
LSKGKEQGVRKYFVQSLLRTLVVLAAIVLVSTSAISKVRAEQLPQVPVPGMVTMVDLGAKQCIPCKLMAPIIEELVKEYQGRAAIVFIDVWDNPDAGPKYGLRAIPTQIFYDAKGLEISRHEGFMDKKSIVAVLQQQGVK